MGQCPRFRCLLRDDKRLKFRVKMNFYDFIVHDTPNIIIPCEIVEKYRITDRRGSLR